MLYLIRHAESEANAKGIYQGQSYNVGLTSGGKKQATAASKALKKYQFEMIYTSPLKRCLETTQIINSAFNKKVKQHNLFLEINHGTWEGKNIKDFNNKERRVLRLWKTKPHTVQMIQGESFSDVVKRCQKILFKFKQTKENFVLVTHDTILRILVLFSMQTNFDNFWKFQLDNCGITKIQTNPLNLVSLNETSHLNGIKTSLGKQAL